MDHIVLLQKKGSLLLGPFKWCRSNWRRKVFATCQNSRLRHGSPQSYVINSASGNIPRPLSRNVKRKGRQWKSPWINWRCTVLGYLKSLGLPNLSDPSKRSPKTSLWWEQHGPTCLTSALNKSSGETPHRRDFISPTVGNQMLRSRHCWKEEVKELPIEHTNFEGEIRTQCEWQAGKNWNLSIVKQSMIVEWINKTISLLYKELTKTRKGLMSRVKPLSLLYKARAEATKGLLSRAKLLDHNPILKHILKTGRDRTIIGSGFWNIHPNMSKAWAVRLVSTNTDEKRQIGCSWKGFCNSIETSRRPRLFVEWTLRDEFTKIHSKELVEISHPQLSSSQFLNSWILISLNYPQSYPNPHWIPQLSELVKSCQDCLTISLWRTLLSYSLLDLMTFVESLTFGSCEA